MLGDSSAIEVQTEPFFGEFKTRSVTQQQVLELASLSTTALTVGQRTWKCIQGHEYTAWRLQGCDQGWVVETVECAEAC